MTHLGQTGITIQAGGETLLGTLFLARGDDPKPTVVLLHGIPGIEKNYDLAHAIRENGHNALIFHYRGCWGSSGTYHVPTIPDDVAAAVSLLRSGTFPQVDAGRLTLVGHSLGGWAAVLAGAADDGIRAVAALAPVGVTSLFPLGDPGFAAEYSPWLTGITSETLAAQWRGLGPERDPVEQVARIAPRPLLIVHSIDDEEVPVEHARRLAERAGPGSRYVETETGNHAYTWQRSWLQRTILEWMRANG